MHRFNWVASCDEDPERSGGSVNVFAKPSRVLELGEPTTGERKLIGGTVGSSPPRAVVFGEPLLLRMPACV